MSAPAVRLSVRSAEERLAALHRELEACRACPKMIGPVVHGPAVPSRILLIGQAPGPREGSFGRPFAWTAGRTLFRWFEGALGVGEADFRRRVYMSAVARCFPGKASGGGDRKPDPEEILRCRTHLEREVGILEPRLILPVGGLAVEQVLGHRGPLASVIGEVRRARYHGVEADVICLPHPSGASTWHKTEPGISLLRRALRLVAEHPETRKTFASASPAAPGEPPCSP
ncbi:uracil-DNA glycosylase family protein [Sorangium sp. So ce1151]|uniref:uracil-DNA glycosylase family protein n=1 Tax=Sorangium sp. So ce1151 TaxID=3133332 RepID=UPI003F5ED326